MELLEKINQLGTTMLVVTHALDLVKQFNKRVITIDQGLIVSDRMGEEKTV
jgi:cell division transport system ATP-binding protein